MAVPLLIFAEDDNEDWILVEDTLKECEDQCSVERVEDGEELLARLEDDTKPTPSLVMLDLKMPRMDGSEALQAIRASKRLRHIPVVIMTTSRTEADIFSAYSKGANSYVLKPVTFEAMKEVLKELHHYWLSVVALPNPLEGTP